MNRSLRIQQQGGDAWRADGWRPTRISGKNSPGIFQRKQSTVGLAGKRNIPNTILYCPRSAAAQLHISESFFRESVKKDPKAPVIMGRGVIACNTPALQEWWDGKNHHRVTGEG